MKNDTDIRIIRLLKDGNTIKEIASELKISPRAVDKRISKMKKAEHCTSTIQLVYNYLTQNVAGSGPKQ